MPPSGGIFHSSTLSLIYLKLAFVKAFLYNSGHTQSTKLINFTVLLLYSLRSGFAVVGETSPAKSNLMSAFKENHD